MDFSKINPNQSDFDLAIALANQLVVDWMKVKENQDLLTAEKQNYLHERGWTVKRTMKKEYFVPQDAFFVLPQEIRNDSKNLRKWLDTYHPYLVFKN